MIGDALMHLLPHSLETPHGDPKPVWRGFVATTTLVLLSVIDQVTILQCTFLYLLLTFKFRINSTKVGAIPNFATEKEQKRNFLDFNDVTLVVVDIKSERFVKSTCLQQDLFDMTMVTIMFDTKTSESESFIDRSIEGTINIMMEVHHF